ncbi:MAG TPA: glycosyltransferase [Planctomycetota bacterium]|nr:glycosyltransferase [Planctomycetota bacterium]
MSSQTHFLHVFSTFAPAGPELRAAGIMLALGKGYRHTVVSCSGRTETAEVIGDQADLRLLEVSPKSGPLGMARALRKVLRAQQPDLLLSYNWGAMDAAFAAKAEGFRHHVHHEDGFNADEASQLKARRNWARRLTLGAAEVVVPSRRLLGIAQSTWKLPKVTLIPNGVHVARFAHDPAVRERFRAAHGIPSQALVVGTVAHLRPVKRLDRLIRACAALETGALGGQPVFLVMVGDGEQAAELRALAQSAAPPGGHVIFPGHLSDPAQAYSAFDVLALSSASEQQPVSVLEAMAAGLPIVSTDVGDVALTVPAECREDLVSIDQEEEAIVAGLAAGLTRVLADGTLRAELGQAGWRQVSERYSFRAMLEAYQAVFARAMQ